MGSAFQTRRGCEVFDGDDKESGLAKCTYDPMGYIRLAIRFLNTTCASTIASGARRVVEKRGVCGGFGRVGRGGTP